MSVDRKLAWAGVLLALPGVVALFRDEHYKISVLVSLLVLLLIAAIFYHQRIGNRPQVTVRKLIKTLEIHDAAGASATLTRCQEFVANYHHIQRIWFRNIVSDGLVSAPLIDGAAPDAQETMGCLLSVAKAYRVPLLKGKHYTVNLAYHLSNSFPAKEEALMHDVDVDTKHLVLEVKLPATRACKTATLYLVAAGEPMHALPGSVTVSDDRLNIKAELRNPRPGYTYDLSWEW